MVSEPLLPTQKYEPAISHQHHNHLSPPEIFYHPVNYISFIQPLI